SEPNIADKLKKGHKAGDKTFRVHLDGYDQTDRLSGKGPHKRETVFFFDDNASLNAIRWKDWKVHFSIMPNGWGGEKETLNFPLAINLRTDPFETSIDSKLYTRWMADNLWLFVPLQQEVGKWLGSFRKFPPRQPSASFTIDKIIQQLQMQSAQAARARAMGQ
ncbi:MAG: arylsulfatase, partial [Pseudomonadota bacterium]|nr:arylsulfatase [Pseudomonadota bacterium]